MKADLVIKNGWVVTPEATARAASPFPMENSSRSEPTSPCRTASRSSMPTGRTSCPASSMRMCISGIPA